jgi:hypothetical protein
MRIDRKQLVMAQDFRGGAWMMRTRQDAADRAGHRVWWQFRLCTVLVTSPLLTLLLLLALTNSPYWWKARTHDVAVRMHSRNARFCRDFSVSRPDEAAVYLRFARQAEARVAYHKALSQKYWRLSTLPWLWIFAPADPPPPP